MVAKTKTDPAAVLERVVASKTFNSVAGRRLQEEGRQALAKLPKGADAKLVRRAWARYLDEAPYEVWRTAHGTREEHTPGLLAELKKHRSMAATFLSASLPAGKVVKASVLHAAFIEAATALTKISSFSHSALTRSAAERIRPFATPAIVEGAREALKGAKAEPDLTELGLWLWLIVILAQDGARPSVAVLRAIAEAAKAAAGDPRGHLDAVRRLIGFYRDTSRDMAKLAEELDRTTGDRDAASPGLTLARSMGLAPEAGGKWWITIVVSGKKGQNAEWFSPKAPYAKLSLNGWRDPSWGLDIHKTKDTYQSFSGKRTLADHFDLKPPKDLAKVREYLDEVAKKLALSWQWSTADCGTNLRGKAKGLVAAWAQSWRP